jgi:hypothetical protein
MLTPKEIEKLVEQINGNFEADRKKVAKLEERIKALEAAAQKTTKAPKEEK